MLVHAHGFAVNRGLAEHVDVELDVRPGLPTFSVIGLGAGAARDARERVQAAVLNSGFGFPRRRVTVNLAPAATSVSGPSFDLALACCVLAAEGEIDGSRLARVGLFAQLGLGGGLRGCDSVSAAAEVAEVVGLAGLIVARRDLKEARAASSVPVAGLASLRDVAVLLARESGAPRRARAAPSGVGRARRAATAGTDASSRQRSGDQQNGGRTAPAARLEQPSRNGDAPPVVPLASGRSRGSHGGRTIGRPP